MSMILNHLSGLGLVLNVSVLSVKTVIFIISNICEAVVSDPMRYLFYF